jgi:hypothetical protein
MLMMRRLKAKVGRGGTVVVQDRVDYPEGTELDLAALDAELTARKLAHAQGGKTYSGEDTIAWLRDRR